VIAFLDVYVALKYSLVECNHIYVLLPLRRNISFFPTETVVVEGTSIVYSAFAGLAFSMSTLIFFVTYPTVGIGVGVAVTVGKGVEVSVGVTGMVVGGIEEVVTVTIGVGVINPPLSSLFPGPSTNAPTPTASTSSDIKTIFAVELTLISLKLYA